MNGQLEPLAGPGTPSKIPPPPHYQESTPGFKAPTSVPPPGQTTVSSGTNPATGRFEIYRNGYRIAHAKTASHAAELAANAATNWPNTYQPPIVTAFEVPYGY